ncbi:molybdopterin-synthase adenylyltransferase MoeB [Agarivorans sp. B2Z047]|uniref:HesA/MoeB/ThiF family protein n=1 Tax=Agarivorans sp. B2Z047 TaxID=2652721 RepID=UPI00128D1C0E|nr:molybdopterin-synthase adenylyltransferase MoeB [Agarivorans sp. B2Z047]MPW29787.1 molybdopterin-synthase adenylyltransferase MoeB [Agarivorans sp. B2Z047]UQN43355.1 molybdopterin-synthase adenylyltransferase MoeB [Agarivorans sp. B2Z047]
MSQTSKQSTLSDQEVLRYSRHLLLKDVGEAGQLKLKSAQVLLVGMGGLGAPAALYLAAAGVGKLVLADFDEVDSSNLQRQVLYREDDIKQPKVVAAKQHLQALNSNIQVRTVNRKMDEMLLAMEVAQADVVLDCSDNIATRYAVNQACVKAKVPLVSGAAVAFDGQLMVFDFRQAEQGCYHCLFPNASEQQLNCSNAGILGPVVGTIGSLQALETIKLIAGTPSAQRGRFSSFDAHSLEWFHLKVNADANCPVCGKDKQTS